MLGDSIVVSATEPTGNNRKKVWFQKGKNYLDISRLTTRTTYGITFTPTATGIKITGTATDTYAYGGSIGIDLKKGKTYTLYGNNAGNTLKLELKKGTTIITAIKTSNNKITFTPNDDINLVTFILEDIVKGTAYNYEISNLQIEQGSTPTEYQPYVEQQIFIKNSNEVYEEFIKKSEEVYSTEKQRIGTWIDGKPLYRITIPNIAVGANKQVAVDLSKYNYNEIWIDNGNTFNHYANSNLTSSGVNWINNDFIDTGTVWINQNKIMNVKNHSTSDRTYFITLKYTKS